MSKYHHLCLVSNQLLPNYFPVLEPGIQASTATLTYSKGMEKKFECLKKVLEEHQVKVEKLEITNEYDFDSLEKEFSAWLEKHENENLVLNVTGGTKPMAIVAQELFRIAGKPIFYVDIEKDNIRWLDPATGKWEIRKQLERQINLMTMLRLHDRRIGSFIQYFDRQDWLKAASVIASHAEEWNKAISELNKTPKSDTLSLRVNHEQNTRDVAGWRELIDTLVQYKVVNCQHLAGRVSPASDGEGRKVTVLSFCSEDARHFACGGWLEAYLFSELIALYRVKNQTLKRDMIALNAKLENVNGTGNEMDVLLVVDRKLFAFECKTGVIGNNAPYKLDSLSNKLGGLRAKGILVSYQMLSDTEKARCRELKLDYLEANDLAPNRLFPNLQKIIRLGK